MNKFLITLVVALASLGTASAQLLGIHPRLEAGISFPQVESTLPAINTSTNTGYRIGGAVELPVFPFVYIAPGVTLRSTQTSYSIEDQAIRDIAGIIGSAIGSEIPSALANLGTSSSNTLTYAIVPVNLGAKFSILGFGISAEVGPYAGWAINSGSFSKEAFTGLGLSFNKFTYGLGASVAGHLGKTYLRIGYEYELSKKFSTNSSIYEGSTPTYRDNALYLTLGYRL